MFLNIWESIRHFFMQLFSKVSWGSIFTLLTGIIIGIILCVFFYLIVLLRSFEKINQESTQPIPNENQKDEEVLSLIQGAKDQYREETESFNTSQKIIEVKDLSWNLIHEIAKTYYPESKYPLYELSIDELIRLNGYITERIDGLFQKRILKMTRNIKVSQIFRIMDAKKKIEDNKIVKGAKKIHLAGIGKTALNALNLINPVHWMKKLMLGMSINIGMNKIALIIIEIVGQETAKVYSKHVFLKQEEELEQEITTLEQQLIQEEGGKNE